SRLFVQIGWDTKDYSNTGSGSELDPVPSAALPIAIDVLKNLIANGDGTFTVTSARAVPPQATGTGAVMIEGHPASIDAAGNYTIAVPVPSVVAYFQITGSTVVPRRKVVDRNRCNTCHDVLTVHGNNRTDN